MVSDAGASNSIRKRKRILFLIIVVTLEVRGCGAQAVEETSHAGSAVPLDRSVRPVVEGHLSMRPLWVFLQNQSKALPEFRALMALYSAIAFVRHSSSFDTPRSL